jgi:hypothetical protein
MIQKSKQATLADEVEDYRRQRVELIKESLQPITLEAGPKIVLHIIPEHSLETDARYDLASVKGEGDELKPMFVGGWGPLRFNFDGLMMLSMGKESAQSYVQVFHTGIVEAANVTWLQRWDNKSYIPARGLEDLLIEATSDYASFQRSLGIEGDLYILLTLLGVKGYFLIRDEGYGFADGRPIDRDDLLIPAVKQREVDADFGIVLRPLLDRIWNAGGFRRSMNYNDAGERVQRR